ncbi:MAG: hypothetical protein Q9217_006362 [Psora testacea]
MTTRAASHAGSWYTDDGLTLSEELEDWLADVNPSIKGLGAVPQPGARAIIAPHAGYAYSGPAAAWAYKYLDLSQAKRVFLLGPSHHKYLTGCALSKHAKYATPIGNLPLDLHTMSQLRSSDQFEDMSVSTDSAEHSLEMHLPYIFYLLSKRFNPANFPPLVPILVGSTNPHTERTYGSLLAPYLADPSNIFIVSSDFCHWGSRFSYTYYLPSLASLPKDGRSLGKREAPSDPPIYESIARIDKMAMSAIESGSYGAFLSNLRDTGNTVCGRHPIGVVMAAIEILKQEGKLTDEKGRFRFVRYERSSEVHEARDSSITLNQEETGVIEPFESTQAFKLLADDPESRLVISFHGNAGTVCQGWRTDAYRALSSGDPSKIHVLTIDYRGYGYSTGVPTEQGVISDGITLAKYAMEVAKIPPEKIVIQGQSLGTAVSVAVAEHFAVEQSIDFKAIILVAAFSDIPTLMSTYAIGGIIPILSPLRPYPFLQRFFASRIQETWLTAQRLGNIVRSSQRLNLYLIHARNDFEIPWSHSDTLFYAAANATTERGMPIKLMSAVKVHEDYGNAGWANTWTARQDDSGKKVIREEIVSAGGHNRVTTFPAVAKAVLNAFDAAA